jgi:elongation factor Ts
LIEVNSETDFVARNEKFQQFVSKLAKEAINYQSDIEKFKSEKDEEVKSHIGIIGENISIRRIAPIKVSEGEIVGYIHNQIAPNMGKIAVLVAIETKNPGQKTKELGEKIAMHIAASKPDSLDISSVDKAKLNREIEVLKDQARATGKPDSIIEKMMEGRIRKYYEEVVLLEQPFVMDDKIKIKDLVAQFSKENGETKISAYGLYILGDGLEKKENNFAEEVAAATKK